MNVHCDLHGSVVIIFRDEDGEPHRFGSPAVIKISRDEVLLESWYHGRLTSTYRHGHDLF